MDVLERVLEVSYCIASASPMINSFKPISVSAKQAIAQP